MSIDVEIERDLPDVLVLKLRGELQGLSLQEDEARLRILTLAAARPAVFELGGLLALDDNGVRLLIRLARALHTKRSKLSIASPNAFVERTLRMANLHTLIPIFASVDEGLECMEIGTATTVNSQN